MHFRAPTPFEHHGDNATGIVLLHAYTGSPRDVNMTARALERAGYGVYAPLFSGHGTIDPQDILTTDANQWWADTQAAVAHMAAQYAQVAVFGLSMGGIFAMKALATLPAVTLGGVFASPLVPGASNVPENFLVYNRYMRKLAGLPDNAEAVKPQVAAQLAHLLTISASVVAALPALLKPVFIAQGGRDELVDPKRAHDLRAALTQAPVAWHWYPEAGHVLTTDQAHHELEQDLVNFMKTRDKG